MISIPVKLYTATTSKDLAFNTLHADCGTRLKQKRWCPVHDAEVTSEEVVRGYEYTKDQYVLISDEDMEKLPVPSKKTVELTGFISQEEIDPVYYETTYFLEPDQIGLKPYALLLKALKTRNVNAIAKVALRNKERLCVLRASEGGIIMETLYYPDEVKLNEQPEVPEVLVSEPELNMALSLIDMLKVPFEPEKYEDDYRTAMIDMIEMKKNGQEIIAAPQAEAPKMVDLMAALKASLEAAKAKSAEQAA
jgi:DNA end-binding protein Ku